MGILTYSFGVRAAELPADAKELLGKLPGKTISLDVVLSRAMKSSDSFEAVASQRPLAEVSSLSARASYDPTVTAKYQWGDNRNEVANVFVPGKIKNSTYGLGAKARLPTGTDITADFTTASNSYAFSTGSTSYYESKLSFGVEQSLWANAFGRATRSQVQAGIAADRATTAGLENSVESWAMGMMEVFYNAWLAKMRVNAMIENTKRRERLEKILRIKTRRGTAEEPDLLQVKSALIGAQAQEAEARQNLADRWQGLVITLKLPVDWLKIDPVLIPISIDDPVPEALRICKEAPAELNDDNEPANIRQAKASASAAESQFIASSSQSHPDLKLKASAASNGIDMTDRARTLEENRNFNDPAYFLGVELSMPLLSRQKEADYRTKLAEKNRTRAVADQAISEWRLRWLTGCETVRRLASTAEMMREALKNQDRRAQLDERRFGIGRSSILSVVQAGDDATTADLTLRGTEVQLRLAAWTVRRQFDGLKSYLTKLQNLEIPGL